MPVQLDQIREMLLPGLWAISRVYPGWTATVTYEEIGLAPVAAIPLKEVIVGLAAVKLAENPVVSRRFWGD